MDRYNINYQGRRCRSYLQSRVRGELLEAEVHNYGCVSGGAVIRGEVGSSGGIHFHQIGLVGGFGGKYLYKIVCLPEPGGRSNLTDVKAKAEAKTEVGANCDEV